MLTPVLGHYVSLSYSWWMSVPLLCTTNCWYCSVWKALKGALCWRSFWRVHFICSVLSPPFISFCSVSGKRAFALAGMGLVSGTLRLRHLCHFWLFLKTLLWRKSHYLRLRSHKHEYESGTVRVPVYEFRQTRVCMYFNGGRSHTYEYGLPVNFTVSYTHLTLPTNREV